MEAVADSWVRPRFNDWLRDRHLHQHLEPCSLSGCMEMQFGRERFDFIKYRYVPSSVRPSFPWPITVFHGTYPCCAARVLHTGKFRCSDQNIPCSDCRWPTPCVFTAETMDHAIDYAWPAPILKDNLYYGIMYELEADRSRLMNCKEYASGTNRHRGEMLFPLDALIIRNVYLLVNLDLKQGSSKCQVLDPSLERLPFTVGASLTFSPLRGSTWYHNR